MTKTQSWLLTVCGCFALTAIGVLALQGREAIISAEKSGVGGLLAKANTTLDNVNGTLDIVNRPCGGGHSCGSLANADKAVVHLSDIAVAAQTQVMQSGKLIAAATDNMNVVGAHVSTVADNLSLTAKAATGAVTQATADLQTANTTIASAQPLIGHLDAVTVSANKSVLDFDALIEQPGWSNTIKSTAGITASLDQILARGYLVEAKATQCYLYPTFKCRVNSLIVPTFQIAGPLIQAFK